ncbi:MAG: hypothetical protein GQ540_03285 [Lutibacter sp.]|uniref:hypothetical protein n=1 Tax=Lutibacter sp. TaxID=1925666 RepID=UPI0019F1466A|nr:hypothetical protein [Lutibacter sp.]NOR27535.1 hypothetical protein [Lutibacter sp.]
MELRHTSRGFSYFEFNDRYNAKCCIQKSSLATEDTIWFGIDDADPKIMASKVMENGVGWVKYPLPEDAILNTRMHLTVEQVKELIPILERFVKTGDVY